jgi:hypothetical protein
VLEAIKSEEQQEQSTRRNQNAAVLADVKAEPSVAAARPALTSSARVGGGNPRSGRKKACGAVEHGVIARRVSCALGEHQKEHRSHVEA